MGVRGARGLVPPLTPLRPRPRRLAKSTLTLIPLLGIHQVVFIFLTDESTRASHSLRVTKLFIDLFFSSFQVDKIMLIIADLLLFTGSVLDSDQSE